MYNCSQCGGTFYCDGGDFSDHVDACQAKAKAKACLAAVPNHQFVVWSLKRLIQSFETKRSKYSGYPPGFVEKRIKQIQDAIFTLQKWQPCEQVAPDPGVRLKDLPKWKAKCDSQRAAKGRRPRYILEDRRDGQCVFLFTPAEVGVFLWGRDLHDWNVFQLQVGLPPLITEIQNILETREMSQCEH